MLNKQEKKVYIEVKNVFYKLQVEFHNLDHKVHLVKAKHKLYQILRIDRKEPNNRKIQETFNYNYKR